MNSFSTSDASSGRRQTLRKELTQCQYCYKSKGPGVSLQRCGGCGVDIYCSKECQRSAWKTHKAKCAINQRFKEMPTEKTDALKALRAFTAKHRPTVAEGGIRALNFQRGDSTRIQTAYTVVSVAVVPIAVFPTSQEMRAQLKQAIEDNRRLGMAGAIFVILMDLDTGVSNVAPVGFGDEPFPPLGTTVEEWLTTRLNEGIIV
ncbi:hypothetical protein C8R47DRAFT_1297351 [Mycena vitilis]|nr:hypothetical protein C8R47DRAFT_1297351 [Mycena vitilis]